MDQALADLQSLQNDMLARWQGPPEIGNYILKPDDIAIQGWVDKFESIRQAMVATLPAGATTTMEPTPPPKAKKP